MYRRLVFAFKFAPSDRVSEKLIAFKNKLWTRGCNMIVALWYTYSKSIPILKIFPQECHLQNILFLIVLLIFHFAINCKIEAFFNHRYVKRKKMKNFII